MYDKPIILGDFYVGRLPMQSPHQSIDRRGKRRCKKVAGEDFRKYMCGRPLNLSHGLIKMLNRNSGAPPETLPNLKYDAPREVCENRK